MKKIILIYILLFTTSLSAFAQIVNVENARIQADSVGWMGNIGASASLAQTVDKVLEATLEAHLQGKTKNRKGIWIMLGNAGFLKVNSSRVVSDDLFHLRFNYNLNKWLVWEFFGQYQTNIITQIDARILFGTGPRFKIINSNLFHLFSACLFMYENEKDRTVPVVHQNDIRNSSYASFIWTPKSYIELTGTTYFQPLMKKFSDYRILGQMSFKVKATPHFSMSVKFSYLHDRFPAGTAPHTTYSFATGLNYELL